MTSGEYFDSLYADSGDPWRLSSSPYERRKLGLVVAALPRPRYRRAFEPGCAIGVTSEALAERCDSLLAMDGAASAVTQARVRLAGLEVDVVPGRIPADWPAGSFDLIVLSELLYYLDDADRLAVADRVGQSLTPGGDVMAVHWRPAFAEAPVSGDQVHAELAERWMARGLELVVDHVEEHFLLQVYRLVSRS